MSGQDEVLDFRFEEVPLDFGTLKDCIDLLERNLPKIIKEGKQRVWQQWGTDDPADRSVAHYQEEQLEQGVTTRYVTGALLIAVWAAYEAAVRKYADHIRRSSNRTLKLSDLKGDFLTRSRKYYDQVLIFELHPTTTNWELLRKVAGVRHALAHANGRMEDIPEEDRRNIQKWVAADATLKILDDEYLLVTFEFVKASWEFVNNLLADLYTRVKAAY